MFPQGAWNDAPFDTHVESHTAAHQEKQRVRNDRLIAIALPVIVRATRIATICCGLTRDTRTTEQLVLPREYEIGRS
jgi:hypothetical protein